MTSFPRRVFITGAGSLCSLGTNSAQCWSALCEGRSGIAPIQSVDMQGLRFQNGAEVHEFRAADYFEAARCDLIDRFAQFAVVAAREAVGTAGFDLSSSQPLAKISSKLAVITGTSMGGQTSLDRGFEAIYKQGRPRPHPFTIPLTMYNAGASQISMDLGTTGPAFTISTACASATHAIGQAFWMVRSGAAEAAICGGSEAPFSPGILRAWEAMRVVSPDVCRPFSRDRRGLTLGEGAAMLYLEPLESAVARNAPILGEVVGFGMSSDAGHITQPNISGPASAIAAALGDAHIPPEVVGYINAHGTGTTANDVTETQAIREVFGAHADTLAISSTKSMHGHALGAAGALEAFATLMALREGMLPPTINFNEPDPECNLDIIPNIARQKQVEFALSNSFAFGGLNAVLAFRRWDKDREEI